MDIYRHIRTGASEKHLVVIGRIFGFSALVLGMICAKPLLGNFDQAFQYIQEFTGFFTPGIVVIFLLGMFWNGMTSYGAIAAALSSALLSFSFKLLWPTLPFIDRVGLVFLLCVVIAVSASFIKPGHRGQDKTVNHRDINYATTSGFNTATIGVILILIALYATWW